MAITINSQPSADVAANDANTFELSSSLNQDTELSFTNITSNGGEMVINVTGNTTINADDIVYIDFASTFTDGYYTVQAATATTIQIDYAYANPSPISIASSTITQTNTGVKINAYLYKLTKEFLSDSNDNGGFLAFNPVNGDENYYTAGDLLFAYEFPTAGTNGIHTCTSIGGGDVITSTSYTAAERGYIGLSGSSLLKMILSNEDGVFNIDMKEISKTLNDEFYNLSVLGKAAGVYSDIEGQDSVTYVLRLKEYKDNYTTSGGALTFVDSSEYGSNVYTTPVRVHNIYLNTTESLSDYIMSTSNLAPFLTTLNPSKVFTGQELQIGFIVDNDTSQAVKLKYSSGGPVAYTSAINVERKRGYAIIDFNDWTAGKTYTFTLVDSATNAALSESLSITPQAVTWGDVITIQYLNRLGGFDTYTFKEVTKESDVQRLLYRNNEDIFKAFHATTMRTALLTGSNESPTTLEALKDMYRTKDIFYIENGVQYETYIKDTNFKEVDRTLFIPSISIHLQNENEKYD